jgi:tetratricopeptide (TPR) repeat protein
MRYLAMCFEPLGRNDEAEPLLRQVLETQSQKFGETHRETMLTRYTLATVLARGRATQNEVEALELECVKQFRQLLGDHHPQTLSAVNSLARLYLNRNEPERAEPLALQALKAARSRMESHDPITREAMVVLAFAYQLQGKYAEAKPLVDELVAEPRTDPETGRSRSKVTVGLRLRGHELVREGKHAEAERAMRECLKLWEKEPAHSAKMNSPRVQLVLGASLLGQKRYAESESELLEAYGGMKPPSTHLIASIKRYEIETLESLVQLYEEWGKPDEAAKWRKELEARKVAEKNPKP